MGLRARAAIRSLERNLATLVAPGRERRWPPLAAATLEDASGRVLGETDFCLPESHWTEININSGLKWAGRGAGCADAS